jgi:hypothetical protein
LAHRDYLMTETLATEWSVGQTDPLFSIDRDLGDVRWTIEISRT